jgi:hypothetical protein
MAGNRFVTLLGAIPAVFYWFIESPVQMVLAGGLAQSALLPLIGIASLYLRHPPAGRYPPVDGHHHHCGSRQR